MKLNPGIAIVLKSVEKDAEVNPSPETIKNNSR
jgi:hypothetical protein